MPSPPRLSKIDETNIDAHPRLLPSDVVYYLYEYTSGHNFTFGATNNLISNLKKSPTRAGRPEYRYKREAIRQCAAVLGPAINPAWLDGATLVPIPPSKARGTPEYDDRVSQICRGITAPFPIDVRELVIQRTSMAAAHESGDMRPTVQDLLDAYAIDEALTQPAPTRIGIVDDVLTAGTHFRAVHVMLERRFPDVPTIGFFVARRVFPPSPVSASAPAS